jgi:hypothetical protein
MVHRMKKIHLNYAYIREVLVSTITASSLMLLLPKDLPHSHGYEAGTFGSPYYNIFFRNKYVMDYRVEFSYNTDLPKPVCWKPN